MPTLGALPAGHPVLRAVETWLEAGYVAPEAPLVVACSGGADSLALAAAVRRVDPAREVLTATVDHQLQAGSEAVAKATARTLRGLGFERCEVLTVTVTGAGGMEAAARDARYDALRALADSVGPSATVLLAHTADDQAETVLLGLGRGSGPRSVAGMRPWRSPWGRPLLGVRRADTESACAAVGLEPWQDPHNEDRAFTRVRLRREVLPLLDEVLGGGVVPALARTADLMSDDLAALDELADRAWRQAALADGGAVEGDTAESGVCCAELRAWPSAVRRRALRAWLRACAPESALTYRHLVRIEGLVMGGRTGQSVRLPGAFDVVLAGARLTLRAATPSAPSNGPGVAG